MDRMKEITITELIKIINYVLIFLKKRLMNSKNFTLQTHMHVHIKCNYSLNK